MEGTKITLKVPRQAGDDPVRAPFIQGKESGKWDMLAVS
jgi:hypothetical protein